MRYTEHHTAEESPFVFYYLTAAADGVLLMMPERPRECSAQRPGRQTVLYGGPPKSPVQEKASALHGFAETLR